jgi:hypothetical protein
MRPHRYFIPLAAAATLIGRFGVSAQGWQTVDDFALAGGNAEARGVAVDAARRVYVVGTANGHAIVRYSADGGTTWGTRDDFVYPAETNNLFNAVTIDHHGDLFVGGASGGHWIVRRSTDQGVSWQIVDDFYRPMISPDQPGTNGVVYSLSSDGQGRVYGTGLMRPTGPSYNFWWVRGSDVGGTNWNTKLLLFSAYGGVSQLACASNEVYVTGNVSDSGPFTGLILRSADQGVTWTTNFEQSQDLHLAITGNSLGYLFSGGYSWSSNTYDWLVRKADPGGTNWTILDRISYGKGGDQANPSSIAIDAAGNVLVTGQLRVPWVISGTNGTTYGGNQIWFTRQYSVAAQEWSTTDLFTYTTNIYGTNIHTVAMGTAIAANGTTFVVGYGTTESGQHRWVVRKRAAARPRLQIANLGGTISVSWPGTDTNSILEWTDSPVGNQAWQVCTETVGKVDGRNSVTCGLTSGARFFRLKSAAGQ